MGFDAFARCTALLTAQERDYDIRLVVGLAEFDAMRNISKFAQLGHAGAGPKRLKY
ncbi:MAG: hypothetical protein ACJAYX_001653 [Planctomycetota bacterium]